MKTYDEDYYLYWLTDNKEDLEKEFCREKEDEFAEYCKNEFNKYCELRE